MTANYRGNGYIPKIGVIFDFDGTLIDSYTHRNLAHLEVGKYLAVLASSKGYKVSADELCATLSEMEKEMTAKFVYDRGLWFIEALKHKFGIEIWLTKKDIYTMTLRYWETVAKNSFLYPSVTEVLLSLRKKYCLGLISDTDGLIGMKTSRLHSSGLESLFDNIIVSGEGEFEIKPHQQSYIRMCEFLNLPPKSCVYIGDNPLVDVLGAQSIGMKTIIVRNSNAFIENSQVNADYSIDRESFDKLELLIERLLNI
jgi:HAD superfamily hydrolase (TIGR01549 family)